jgi:hypothetical protein
VRVMHSGLFCRVDDDSRASGPPQGVVVRRPSLGSGVGGGRGSVGRPGAADGPGTRMPPCRGLAARADSGGISPKYPRILQGNVDQCLLGWPTGLAYWVALLGCPIRPQTIVRAVRCHDARE